MGKPYKLSELNMIKENYHVIPVQEIAHKLKRTKSAVFSMAFILGLSKRKSKKVRKIVHWDIKGLKKIRHGEKMDNE